MKALIENLAKSEVYSVLQLNSNGTNSEMINKKPILNAFSMSLLTSNDKVNSLKQMR